MAKRVIDQARTVVEDLPHGHGRRAGESQGRRTILDLIWTPALSTGVLELDHQHQKLFEFINDLKRKLADPAARKDKAQISSAVRFIREYTEIHFRTEEICMTKYQCPVAGVNKEAHGRFLEEAMSFEKGLQAMVSPEAALRKFENFLGSWWTSHICSIDVRLKDVAPAA